MAGCGFHSSSIKGRASMEFDVIGFLKEKGLEVVDKRKAGEAL